MTTQFTKKLILIFFIHNVQTNTQYNVDYNAEYKDSKRVRLRISTIEKVLRGIQSEKSSEHTASSRNLVSTMGAKVSPQKGDGTRCQKGKRSLLACHTRFKFSMETTHNSEKVKRGIKVMKLVESLIGWTVAIGQGLECHLTNCEDTSYYCIRSPYRPSNFLNDDFKRTTRYPCLSSLLESRLALRIKHSHQEQARAYCKSLEIKPNSYIMVLKGIVIWLFPKDEYS